MKNMKKYTQIALGVVFALFQCLFAEQTNLLAIKNAVMIEFQSTAELSYTIQQSTDLISWTNLTSGIHGNGTIEKYFFEPITPRNYYRLISVLRPTVVSTWPMSGSTNISHLTNEIRVTFSQDMHTHSWSWCTSPDGQYPETTGSPYYQTDKRTCVLPVILQPNTQYAIRINIDGIYENFRTPSLIPAVPYLIVFKTE